MCKCIIACLFCFSVFAADNYYSVVTIKNATPFRIYYSYKWGDGDETFRNSIPPWESYIHWWTFDYANQDWAPWFYVQIDGRNSWFKLGSFFSSEHSSDDGRLYRFFEEGSGNDREIILQERLYTE